MAEQMRRSLLVGDLDMDDKERAVLKEQIDWLGAKLDHQRKINKSYKSFISSLVHPEELGHAVSQEVRQTAYVLLINNQLEN